ncbi:MULTISPECIES: DUF4232 domain-containing protein [unclassified Streptomyces]|uniref:DUF4232 domain-containing protein n=1 Tax=unclassified Streptomyces TaxID=2593676 RepID=UPI003D9261C8
MSARTTGTARAFRTRLLAATAVLAALGLTACQNGEGVRDEGPSSESTLSDGPVRGAGGPGTAAPCSGGHTRTTATPVSRPTDHLLLTVTNTGATNCTLTGYPKARFGGADSSAPPARETRPRSAVTLSPGASAYAGVLLSAADGTGGHGRTVKTLTVALPDGHTVHPALPGEGVHVDDKVTVTYWLSNREAALTY